MNGILAYHSSPVFATPACIPRVQENALAIPLRDCFLSYLTTPAPAHLLSPISNHSPNTAPLRHRYRQTQDELGSSLLQLKDPEISFQSLHG